MKKNLHDIFSISRNERIGLICLTIILAIVIGYTAFSPNKYESSVPPQELATEFTIISDSSRVDSIKQRRRDKAKKPVQKHTTLTASALEEVETF